MQRHFVEARYRLPMRRMVWMGCLWMLGLGSIMVLVAAMAAVANTQSLVIAASIVLLQLGCMMLARLGQWDWMVRCFVWGNWLLTVLLLLHTGGLYTPVVIAFPAWLVVAVWAQGVQSASMMLGASLAVLGVCGWQMERVFWPVELSTSTLLMTMVHVLGMMLLVLMVSLQARLSLGRRVRRGQEMLATLEASQHELRKFYRAVEQNPESIVITDPALNVEYVNEAFLTRSGYTREQVLGQSTERVSTMGLDRMQRERALSQLASGTVWRGEMTNRTCGGEPLRELVLVAPIRTAQGEIVNYVELKRDLSERVLAERRIHELVYMDTLTGLPNRHSLTLHLRELALSRQEACHGLLLLEVDRFSVFHDAHGVKRSNELLQALSECLVSTLAEDLWVARIATAEFAVVFDALHLHAEGAEQQLLHYAQTLKASLEKPLSLHSWDDVELITCSMGGGVLDPLGQGGDGADVLRFASVALNEAKQSGPGSLRLFEPRMAKELDRKVRIAKDLHNGIPQGELRLYLQTQTDARGRCVGAEALVRWQHPHWGLVSPAEFIPVAEESELIVRLGDWVLRQACQLLASPAMVERGLRLSVNISALQLGHENFMTTLENVLRETGAYPHQLTLEITEGVVVRDLTLARTRIEQLSHMGIEISLDDFGTGYSSMYSLQHLPIHEIKVDQSFVRASLGSEKNAALVEAMLLMARRLRLRVVAEGVERSEQVLQLAQWNSDIVLQGMLLGRPMPQQQWVEEMLSTQPKEVYSGGNEKSP